MSGHLTSCDCDLCRMHVYPVTLTTDGPPPLGRLVPVALPLLDDARLLRLRHLANATGSGWTCVQPLAGPVTCTAPGCRAPATRLWVPMRGDVLARCAHHPPGEGV